MEENRYSINWLSLFIKVIVFVVVVLLAIWLISKITLRNKGLSFEENNKLFQDASVEYFSKNLPKEKENLSVTLSQLITWDYLDKLKNEDGKVCDVKNSRANIEQVENYYSIKVEFVCDSKSETTYIKLGNEKCDSCDVKVDGLKMITEEKPEDKTDDSDNSKKEENSTNNVENNSGGNSTVNSGSSKGPSVTTNNNSNNMVDNSSEKEEVLYEYVKEVNEYSEWYVGKVTGLNIENSTKEVSYSEFCKNGEITYYTVSYIPAYIQKYSYTLELKNIDTNYKIETSKANYFTDLSDYQNYIDSRNENLSMVNVNESGVIKITNSTILRDSSLTSKNYTFDVSKPYIKNNKYYVDIAVDVENLSGANNPYFSFDLKRHIYFVSIKFYVNYNKENNCIIDKTENSSNYDGYTITRTWDETIDIYRYKITTKEYKYSNATSLEGYTKTGNTKKAS